jgi:hypothetical protein
MSTEEIAALICEHLKKQGFEATLTGGACVSIYSHNKYQSSDLDYVMPIYDLNKTDRAMKELGFDRIKSHRHYVNRNCPFYVEFPPPPLSIGGEVVSKINHLKTDYGELRILTPTDSVKDRLAAFYHWSDHQSLEQALLVAREQKIDIANIRAWSKREMSMDKFKEFETLLKKK